MTGNLINLTDLVMEFMNKKSEPLGFKEIKENFQEVSDVDLLAELQKLSNQGKM